MKETDRSFKWSTLSENSMNAHKRTPFVFDPQNAANMHRFRRLFTNTVPTSQRLPNLWFAAQKPQRASDTVKTLLNQQ